MDTVQPDVTNLDDLLEDIVNHPNHYKSEGDGSIECIDAIQSALSAEESKVSVRVTHSSTHGELTGSMMYVLTLRSVVGILISYWITLHEIPC
tara:strand:+ start:14 stop:292 length:279 start_codon:yes stop_codon:yes gene_type:complete